MEVCRQVFPAMKEINNEHQVACYWIASKKS